jgi:hypothetical protein
LVANLEIPALVGKPIDRKNNGRATVVFGLRQDLDVHAMLAVNWNMIKERSFGIPFFTQVRYRVLDSIVLGVCKIYENEKRNRLNSIDAIVKELSQLQPKSLDDTAMKTFLETYKSSLIGKPPTEALRSTVDQFRGMHSAELKSFRTARDKVIAHTEYDVLSQIVPGPEVMERLFEFAADVYAVIASSFVGSSPNNLRKNRPVRTSLRRLLREIGLSNVKIDMD